MTPSPTLTIATLAEELGRSQSYIRHHWRELVTRHGLPRPISGADIATTGGGGALCWSRAHIYAWLDRQMPPPQRAAAAAWRAASTSYAAGGATADDEQITTHRERLNRQFGIEQQP